jgi:photosystem II stability/assembly factor-like uncharacterized protein
MKSEPLNSGPALKGILTTQFGRSLSLVVLSICMTVLARAGWETKTPPGLFSGDFTRICVTEGGQVVWIVGNGGIAASSSDSGNTWRIVPTGITNDFKGVFFLNRSIGWIVGGADPWFSSSEGIVLSTTNGGSSWSIQKTSQDIYYQVQFFDKYNGWVVGLDATYRINNAGAILHTTDGGTNWLSVSTQAGYLWCMNFLNPSTGFLGADPRGILGGDIWKTTNGGNSWSSFTLPYVNDNRRVTDIHMADSLHACCIVPGEGVKMTSDGGASWSPILAYQNLVRCTNAGPSIWFVAAPNVILMTTNSGASWDTAFKSSGIDDIVDLTFLDSNHGMGLTKRGLILSTSNGGLTWTVTQPTVRSFVSPNILTPSSFIVGADGGRVWKSSNGGDSWGTNSIPTFADISYLIYVSDQLGWVSTSSGAYKTTNGGTSWELLTQDVLIPLVVLNRQRLVAGVEQTFYGVHGYSYTVGSLVTSADQGRSWTRTYEKTYAPRPKSIRFWNDWHGLAAFNGDSSSTIVCTTDSGNTWSDEAQAPYGDLRSLSLVGDSIAWALSSIAGADSTMIVESSDAGRHWNPVARLGGFLSSLFFLDNYNGWIRGSQGIIYHTTDAGSLWTLTRTTPGFDLNAITFFDSSSGLAVGSSGTVLKTTDGGVTFVRESPTTLPHLVDLDQNYPNPFNPSTTIRYALPNRALVTMTVFNTLGQQVATLVNESQEAGYHDVRFDGSGLASGVYFYRLQAGSFVQSKKFVLLR